MMGSPESEEDHYGNERQHRVTVKGGHQRKVAQVGTTGSPGNEPSDRRTQSSRINIARLYAGGLNGPVGVYLNPCTSRVALVGWYVVGCIVGYFYFF